MSSSVTLSIATNSAIAASKGFGWFVTGPPTLFAEMIHSFADVGNQVLLKVGELRSGKAPDELHPFGTAQEKYFWALVSAVSVFFIGCGINVYHGVQALHHAEPVVPFGPLVIGLLIFALALELVTFGVALREIGGFKGIRRNRHDTTVLAVLLEDAVALLGIVLTLIVGASTYVFGPHLEFDAYVAIGVGVLLGAMALFLAAVNQRVLIDTSESLVDRKAERWLAERKLAANVRSLVLDSDRVVLFIRADREVARSTALAKELLATLRSQRNVDVDAVYWSFAGAAPQRNSDVPPR